MPRYRTNPRRARRVVKRVREDLPALDAELSRCMARALAVAGRIVELPKAAEGAPGYGRGRKGKAG